jgi:hypothetical protein
LSEGFYGGAILTNLSKKISTALKTISNVIRSRPTAWESSTFNLANPFGSLLSQVSSAMKISFDVAIKQSSVMAAVLSNDKGEIILAFTIKQRESNGSSPILSAIRINSEKDPPM